ncbi:hypothetical protein PHYBLDRAFT_173298 [Phycomyces blakesleeanus NRRL 1555(-)]|uniref:Uncharacterized protein n=1 Tax=Phycomyces blakesleeanus (strain ATCC 8743b / DSM 1359 / FGSC 10004 / NBRC 33097 / NRRL 1555) TaxID=763407 RepID=A0A162ZPS9_PHYB8|nr:hypothetical protein PHYBLDRAFT_173298 [Phycomyces blakesleeanus NRRL 1555(-)]OAD68291.1 hypothetical protein PHYBLDRAFT_173298 [Phycomyces blakesleeanus NRRL 1555(-)]|eukprot:XP_018286331.1 hypothetical protein PHYBLDRAFT_173298 [Phycomyces blakesleeanus NRRL 1555(-)]
MDVSYYKCLSKSAYKKIFTVSISFISLKYLNSCLLICSKPKKTKKTTTKKSVQQTTGTAASTRQWEILPSLTVSAELDGTVLSTLSTMSTQLNESYSLVEKVYYNMGATNGQLIHSQTRAVLATMPLTVNESAFLTSNHPIADVVQSYTHQQAELWKRKPEDIFCICFKEQKLAKKDSLTKSDFLTPVQKEKYYKAIHLADKTNLESKFSETVVDLLDYDMLSYIESDEEKNKTRYTSRNRHPLRLANKGPDVIDNSVYPIILRNTKLSNEKKACVAAVIFLEKKKNKVQTRSMAKKMVNVRY